MVKNLCDGYCVSSPFGAIAAEVPMSSCAVVLNAVQLTHYLMSEGLVEYSGNFLTTKTASPFGARKLSVCSSRSASSPVPYFWCVYSFHVCVAGILVVWRLPEDRVACRKRNRGSDGSLARLATLACLFRFLRIDFAKGHTNQEKARSLRVKTSVSTESCVRCSTLWSNKLFNDPLWAMSGFTCLINME